MEEASIKYQTAKKGALRSQIRFVVLFNRFLIKGHMSHQLESGPSCKLDVATIKVTLNATVIF